MYWWVCLKEHTCGGIWLKQKNYLRTVLSIAGDDNKLSSSLSNKSIFMKFCLMGADHLLLSALYVNCKIWLNIVEEKKKRKKEKQKYLLGFITSLLFCFHSWGYSHHLRSTSSVFSDFCSWENEEHWSSVCYRKPPEFLFYLLVSEPHSERQKEHEEHCQNVL